MSIDALTASLADLHHRVAEVQAQVGAAADQVRQSTRAELTEKLNHAVRRLRQSESRAVWYRTLLEATREFAGRTAAFSVSTRMIRHEGDTAAEVPLASAPAFANAVESKDIVVAAATPRELSPELFGLLGATAGTKMWLFPLVVRDTVEGVICAAPGESQVDVSAIELLCSLASTCVEATEPVNSEPVGAEPPPTDLIRIAGVFDKPKPSAAPRPSWADLSLPEQQTHLSAQRFARNFVADLVLNKSEKVRRGRASKDLYITLREEIDAARDNFRRHFAQACPTMVDYLHLELLRTLAKDDALALGAAYPGPLR